MKVLPAAAARKILGRKWRCVVLESITGCSVAVCFKQGSGMNAWRRIFALLGPAVEDHGKWAKKTFREKRALTEAQRLGLPAG
jgi:hypothetical protein